MAKAREMKRVGNLLGAAVAMMFAVGTGYAAFIALVRASVLGAVLCGILALFGIVYALVFLAQAGKRMG